MKRQEYKSIFISDLHLGSRASDGDIICDFLKKHSAENLFLVGDIIDGWRLKQSWYFPQEHINVIRRILTESKRGTNVYYIIGNHDEVLRKYLDPHISLGNIEIHNEYSYEALNGQKYLVIHGDKFDQLMLNKKWLMHLGDTLYGFAVWLNIHLNTIRRIFGMEYWSLSNWLKQRTKQAVNYIHRYEDHVAEYCTNNDYDGIICGHIHFPEIKTIGGIEYINDGDLCESYTAVVETYDGKFQMLKYVKGNWVVHK